MRNTNAREQYQRQSKPNEACQRQSKPELTLRKPVGLPPQPADVLTDRLRL